MTYSGVLMLVMCAAAARLLFYPRERIWPAVAVPALLVALALTLTRNAWIGARAGDRCPAGFRRLEAGRDPACWPSCCSCWSRRRTSARALSGFDPNDATNRDRLRCSRWATR